eukprot:4179808-Prymnesium_polylepis.1
MAATKAKEAVLGAGSKEGGSGGGFAVSRPSLAMVGARRMPQRRGGSNGWGRCSAGRRHSRGCRRSRTRCARSLSRRCTRSRASTCARCSPRTRSTRRATM